MQDLPLACLGGLGLDFGQACSRQPRICCWLVHPEAWFSGAEPQFRVHRRFHWSSHLWKSTIIIVISNEWQSHLWFHPIWSSTKLKTVGWHTMLCHRLLCTNVIGEIRVISCVTAVISRQLQWCNSNSQRAREVEKIGFFSFCRLPANVSKYYTSYLGKPDGRPETRESVWPWPGGLVRFCTLSVGSGAAKTFEAILLRLLDAAGSLSPPPKMLLDPPPGGRKTLGEHNNSIVFNHLTKVCHKRTKQKRDIWMHTEFFWNVWKTMFWAKMWKVLAF